MIQGLKIQPLLKDLEVFNSLREGTACAQGAGGYLEGCAFDLQTENIC